MAWVVDTCLLIDVAEADPQFGIASAQLLDRRRPDGLVICPVSNVEFAPVFNADEKLQTQFLANLGISWQEAWSAADTRAAQLAWHDYVRRRRSGACPKRPLADILIGAYALRFQGLLTRNQTEFRQLFPSLPILTP